MKIVFISLSYSPVIGGVEKHIQKLAGQITRAGHDLTIITHKDNSQLKDREIIDGVLVYRFNLFNKINNWLTAIKNIKLFRQADIVHIHDYYCFIFWYLPLRFLLFKKPVYITFHGYEGRVPPRLIIVIFRKITELLTNGNICIGDFIKKWYHTKPNYVIYGGTDIVPLSEKNSNKAVFIGRLEKDTGIKEYLEAFKEIKDKDFALEIYGYGSLEEEIRDYILKNKIKAELKGITNDPREIFSQSRFAFVSGYLAILEAISCQCLVFSIYQNKLKEDYLKLMPLADKIIIFNKKEELVDKIKYFQENPNQINEKISRAYQEIKKYTWENVFNTYKKLWKIK